MDSDNNEYHTYAPSHFVRTVKNLRKSNQRPYFKSFDVMTKGENTMANFELRFKDENTNFQIFEKTPAVSNKKV